MDTEAAHREIWALCRVPRSEICFLRYTLEGYEGLCLATTLAGGEGRVRLATSGERRAELEEVLLDLAGQTGLEVLAWGGWAPAASAEEDREMEKVRARVVVRGRVQGVWFRASTRETADRLGLAGWVRNVGDGSVEAVFEGSRSAVEEALAWCRTGPPAARVVGCEESWEPAPEGLEGFVVRRDG